MDPFSTGASVLAFVGILNSLQLITRTLSAVKDGPENVQRLARDVTQLRSVIEQLQAQQKPDTLDAATKSQLANRAQVIGQLAGKLSKLNINPEEKRFGRIWMRVRTGLSEKDFDRMGFIIDNCTSTLTLQLMIGQRTIFCQNRRPRIAHYTNDYTREIFREMWKGKENLCPYWDEEMEFRDDKRYDASTNEGTGCDDGDDDETIATKAAEDSILSLTQEILPDTIWPIHMSPSFDFGTQGHNHHYGEGEGSDMLLDNPWELSISGEPILGMNKDLSQVEEHSYSAWCIDQDK